MADAGDRVSSEFASEAAYNNPRRFVVPPLVNEYAAIKLTRQIYFVDSAGNSNDICSIPHTNNMNSLYFVNLWGPGNPTVSYQLYANYGAPNPGLLPSVIRTGSALAATLNNSYDFSRIRSMKFLFEPVVLQPATNYPAIDVYVCWVPNHFTFDNGNPRNEYDTFADFRDAIGADRITKVAHHAGQSFAIRFVPQIGERVQFAPAGGAETLHDIPAPWLYRGQDPQLYTPLVVFRRPFSQGVANTGYSVSMKCVLEFKDANPNDEN